MKRILLALTIIFSSLILSCFIYLHYFASKYNKARKNKFCGGKYFHLPLFGGGWEGEGFVHVHSFAKDLGIFLLHLFREA